MLLMKRMGMGNQHTIHIMDVCEEHDAALIGYKEQQQAESRHEGAICLHVLYLHSSLF